MATNDMSDDEKRHDQLTTAPQADESDAAPRIAVTENEDGPTRIDVLDDAKYRPGGFEPREKSDD